MFRLNLLNNVINRVSKVNNYIHIHTNIDKNVTNKIDDYGRSAKYLKSTFDRIVINKLFTNNNEIYQNDSKKFEKLTKYTTKMLEYNVSDGNMLAIRLYLDLMDRTFPKNQMTNDQKLTVGWCINMIHASVRIVDDLVDGDQMWFGKKSWHTIQASKAIFDSHLCRELASFLLTVEVKDNFNCARMNNFISEVNRVTNFGQVMADIIDCADDKATRVVNNFSMETYLDMIRMKAGHYGALIPMELAMLSSTNGSIDPTMHKQFRELGLTFGDSLQMLDDICDRISDIKKGQCSYPIVKALEIANEEQREILVKFYGVDENKVLRIYEQLEFDNILRDEVNQIATKLKRDISNLENTFSVDCSPLTDCIDNYLKYKRNLLIQ